MNVQKRYGQDSELIWHDRKRFMGMPLSFTRFYLIRKPGAWFKVISDIGLTFSTIDEVNLYRIFDISLHQSLVDKIFNTGTVVLYSNDERSPKFVLKNIKDPYKIRELFSNYVEEQRKLNNVQVTEFQH